MARKSVNSQVQRQLLLTCFHCQQQAVEKILKAFLRSKSVGGFIRHPLTDNDKKEGLLCLDFGLLSFSLMIMF